ncbi:unannotated protein [freshwater metagenome]|uniref:Unannotated protein n=1 Tax=freshwater metagenome TaxID=449393 RepID=A0A6J7FQJ1_9ZZZZ|nr:hypothetical protein [Actinomycetota bacterium]
MADGADPLGRLIDIVLYAPVGLLTLAQKELPDLIAAGKTRVDNQITLARFIGKMALRQGSSEFKRRMQATDQARQPQVVPVHVVQQATSTTAPASAIGGAHSADQVGVGLTESDVAIDAYDSLAASQVVLRLGSLDGIELETVRQYETSHRARRTILGKITQLQAR